MEWLLKISNAVWIIFLEMSPYLILGFAISGILHVFVPKSLFSKHIGKPGFWSSFKAAMIGIPLPLCSCGVIPTGISLNKNGASKGATNSFLISTPQTGVDSILITYSLMNIYWAISRPFIALITGVVGGWATDKINSNESTNTIKQNDIDQKTNDSSNKITAFFKYAFFDFLSDISRQLLLGVFLASLITVLIPESFFSEYMNTPILNMLIILVASIPLYVCATGSVPIATSLLIAGVSPGAVLVFLMAGPATNIATLTVLWQSLGKKVTLIYLLSIVFGALLFGLTIDYILNPDLFKLSEDTIHLHNHSNGNIISITSSIILILLIIFVEIKKLVPTKIDTENMESKYHIEGMTCNHCKASVESNLIKQTNVDEAIVDLHSKSVFIKGNISSDEVRNVVNDLGYIFKGNVK